MFPTGATAISPIPALRTFGIFCGLVVTANFILVITYFPAMVLLWSKRFEAKEASSTAGDAAIEYGGAERAFERYGRALADRRVRRVVLLLFAALIGAMAICSAHLPQPVAMPMLFPPDHNAAIDQSAHVRPL